MTKGVTDHRSLLQNTTASLMRGFCCIVERSQGNYPMITHYNWIAFWADCHHPVAIIRMNVSIWELIAINDERDQLLTGYCKHLETVFKGSTIIWSPETYPLQASSHTVDIDTAAYEAWAEFFEPSLDLATDQRMLVPA